MKAAILSIGSELVQGFLSDTNSTYLARELNQVGIEVVGAFHVGDDLEHLVRALSRAIEDAELVVCTGGIGPTADDLTREAVASVCNEQPTIDSETLETVRSFFRRRGAEMPDQNAKQAWKTPSAEILANPAGTAPGWFVRNAGKVIVLMPGVPREMMPMWQHQVVPRLTPFLPAGSIEVETLKTIGLGESLVEQMLTHIIGRGFPIVSTYAKNDGVHVRIVAASDNPVEARDALTAAREEICEVLGDNVYGDLDVSLPRAVLLPLKEVGYEVDIWESGTGGQVASLLLSDESVADIVNEARIVGLRSSDLRGNIDEPIKRARLALGDLPGLPGDHFLIGVAVALGHHDVAGRYDARVGIVIKWDDEEVAVEHKVAGAPQEVGRRASLLAAEALRRAALAATSPRQS